MRLAMKICDIQIVYPRHCFQADVVLNQGLFLVVRHWLGHAPPDRVHPFDLPLAEGDVVGSAPVL
jgi:hypothetical protein